MADPLALLEHYLLQGDIELAEALVCNAHNFDSNLPSVREGMRDIDERQINRWHFLMLNDVTRNALFNESITNAMKHLNNPIILDIGAGTGILSLMAVRGGASHVYGCDVSRVMIKLSRDVIAANQMEDKITILHSLSNDITIPTHIPTRVSMVVTETFDAGLLGEHVIASLRHAWKELLINDDSSLVIPRAATVHVAAVECFEIRRKTRLINPTIKLFEGLTVIGSCQLSSSAVLVKEQYTTEDLSNVKGGATLLTTSKECLKFDFSNPKVPLPDPVTVPLSVTRSGTIDAIVVWFDLHLDGNRSLSTSPSSGTKWEQAVYPMEYNHPVIANNNDEINITISCNETQLFIADHIPPDCSNQTIVYIERSDLSRLNDAAFINTFITSLKCLMASLTDENDIRIIELSGGLPLMPLADSISDDCFILAGCSKLYMSLLQQLVSNDNIVFVSEIPPTLINTTWDIMLMSDIVSPQGVLSNKAIAALGKIDITGCSVIPCSIEIILMGVASPGMRAVSSVLGTVPTIGLDIARHINEYQITHLTDIDMSTILYDKVTEVKAVHTMDWHEPLDVTKTTTLTAMEDGIITGIAYWFVLHLHGNHSLSTGPSFPSSKSHWNQSVFLTSDDIQINKGQDLTITFKLIDGFIDIELVN